MRARNIKPGFYKNEYLAELSMAARLLFIGLWLMADKEGRLECRPKRIKAELFPYDSVNIEKLLDELCKPTSDNSKFVSRYEAEDCQFLFIHKFVEHQNPHKNEKESVIPPFTEYPEITGQVQNLHPSTRAESPILNPESPILNPESIPQKKKAGARAKKVDDSILPDWLDTELWGAFREHRVEIKKPMTSRAEMLNIAELSKLITSGCSQEDIINQSIAQGWKGLFPVKQKVCKNGKDRAGTRKGNGGFVEARKSGETNWLE